VEQTDQIIGKTIQDENKFSGNGYGISDFLKFRDSTIEIKYVLKNVNYFDVKLIQNNGREDFILSLKDSNIKNGVKEINVQDSIYIFDFESDGKWEIEILNK
jgi:hypothetical protein